MTSPAMPSRERKLIEVRLQVLWADSMMDTEQPSLEVREYEMNNGHKFFSNLRIAPFGYGYVVIPYLESPA